VADDIREGRVRAMGDLESLPAGRAGDFLRVLETLPLRESGPLVLLGAMLERVAVPGRLPLEEVPEAMARVSRKSARLQADLEAASTTRLSRNDILCHRHDVESSGNLAARKTARWT